MKKTGRIEANEHGHGNRVSVQRKPDSVRWPLLTVRKVPADSVPYGSSISTNGKHVWCAYHDGVLIAVGATADEARRKYRYVQYTTVQDKKVTGKILTAKDL